MSSTFLSKHGQSELLANKGNIVTISQSVSADEALKTLIKNHILSAPCVDGQSKVIGLLDMVDFCEAILQLLPSSTGSKENALRTSIAMSNLFSSLEAKTVDQMTLTSKLQTASISATLFDLVKHLANGKHRVVITNEDNTVANIITQSSVLDFVSKHVDEIGDVVNRTVADAKLGNQGANNLIALRTTDTAADGFRQMVENKISAVPVLQADGQLMGNLSVSDLKGIGDNYEVNHLMLPVMQFLQRAHAEDVDVKSPTIVCRTSSPLRDVIQRMSAAHIHRIYVVDESQHVCGIITLTDVMRSLQEN